MRNKKGKNQRDEEAYKQDFSNPTRVQYVYFDIL